jgi:hypothetical protein
VKLTPLQLGVGAAVLATAACYIWRDSLMGGMRASATRHLAPSAVRGATLDHALGQVTPEHLLFFGPTMRPPHWTPHRVRYTRRPGEEMERLMMGAPGSCGVSVPRESRGWLWAPPSEVDY